MVHQRKLTQLVNKYIYDVCFRVHNFHPNYLKKSPIDEVSSTPCETKVNFSLNSIFRMFPDEACFLKFEIIILLSSILLKNYFCNLPLQVFV